MLQTSLHLFSLPFGHSLTLKAKRLALFLVFSTFLASSACEEGPGGTAGIAGRVIVQQFDLYGVLFDEYPAADERVFLVYGQDSIIGDETRTHYSGRYQFDFLRKGVYTVYVLSPCAACPGNEQAITAEVEITQSGQLTEAPVLYIRQE